MDKKFKPTSEIVEYFTNKRTTTEIRTKINDYKTELKKEEEVLRKEVRRNYRAFLRTNEEIRLMESNITDLKRLVDESIQLVKVRI